MDMQPHLKRLYYRSWHRGCKETDLILGSFAEHRLAELSPELLAVYERLLDEDDVDIWDWVIGKKTPKAEYGGLIDILRASCLVPRA
jgi:antitoxin CptB